MLAKRSDHIGQNNAQFDWIENCVSANVTWIERILIVFLPIWSGCILFNDVNYLAYDFGLNFLLHCI